MKKIVAVLLLFSFLWAGAPKTECSAARWNADDGVILSGKGDSRKIALTFDDGPHPYKTDKILDLLETYNIHATFFVIGQNVAAHPEIVCREIALGHEIGNHTYSHKSLAKCSKEFVEKEITATEEILLEKTGCAPKLFRPPEGAYTCDIILWTVDTRDWAKTPAASIANTVIGKVSGGSIILFHDFTISGAHTLEALEILIPKLLDMGYEFVTVSELIGNQ